MSDDRVAIVTGGGRGIGRSHCLELARAGVRVVVNDLDGEAAAAVCAEVESAGGFATPVAASVSDHQAMERLVRTTIDDFGHLDAIVNNAGVLRDRMITSMSEDDFDIVLSTHVKGTWSLTRHACEYWRERSKAGERRDARVVNTTSGTGLFGNIGQSNYGAAKAAIANLTMITAMEMGRHGVTANAISPIARTQMTEGLPGMAAPTDEDQWDPYDPANAAPVVAWLCSPESSWLTGAVLRVDGDTVQRMEPWQVDPSAQYRTGERERLDRQQLDLGMRRAFGVTPRGMLAGSITS